MTNLADVLTNPDDDGLIRPATIVALNSDGTCTIDLGGGRQVVSCPILVSGYTPGVGDRVEVIRRDSTSYLVLGAVRDSNVTTVAVGRSWRFPYNVLPATVAAANPLTVSATATKSYRSGDWERDEVFQGAYSTAFYGYWYGCYFYGSSPFAALIGRRCTRLRIRIERSGSGGIAGPERQWIAPHVHPSVPSGAPIWKAAAYNAGSVAWNGSVDLDLPVAWGQGLINGTIKGFGHRYSGTADYSIADSKAAASTSGRLILDWS